MVSNIPLIVDEVSLKVSSDAIIWWKGCSHSYVGYYTCLIQKGIVLCFTAEEKEEEEAKLKDLLNELCDITHWFWFGVSLGVPQARLLQIKEEYRDIQACIREVLLEWKKQETPKWSKVIQALPKGYRHKANILAKRYG